MTAIIFLNTSTTPMSPNFLSDEIVAPPNGSIIIQFNGTMEADERWVIEQARIGDTANTAWSAVHRTDALTGTIAEWQGGRDLNRVFVVAVSDSCRYRVRKVSGTAGVTENRNVTAFWAEWQTRLSL